ncbi:hypothetical protein HPB50_022747 [Hyalomma asiaticum]|uniref:Uncharacterized protein n=1 Tax=Hyalomma asiaticum TaxID=266040 RepID=A0ACB7RS87_HYAAI|nr:hypothetical protein HPB50_022747 [Hyalomma asiaticum]
MGRADELKLEIEALKLQLEVEKLKTARFLQNAVQARSETSGLGRYAKDLKAVLVPMPADDTMVPAWFKMVDMLLKMLGVPEEMQGTLILPFLTEKIRTSLSGTCSYGELKEKVLKELKLTPTEYRRCFPEIKKEVREQSCDRTKLTGSFGKAVTTEVARVPVGLPCPSENARRVSLPVSRELATNADVLMTPGDHDNHCLAMSRSEPKLEGSVCGLVERSAEQAVILANGNGVDTATPFCEEEIARDAVREEPNKGDEDDVCSEASRHMKASAHESEVSRDNKISEQEADPASGGREQASIAKVGAAGDPAQVCSLMEKERPVPFRANAFAKERVLEKLSAEAHHVFDVVGEPVASMPALAAPFSWSRKAVGHCPSREEDRDQRGVTVLSKGQAPAWEKESAAEQASALAAHALLSSSSLISFKCECKAGSVPLDSVDSADASDEVRWSDVVPSTRGPPVALSLEAPSGCVCSVCSDSRRIAKRQSPCPGRADTSLVY